MAYTPIKISALPAGTALTGTEEIVGVQSGVTVSFTATQIAAFCGGITSVGADSPESTLNITNSPLTANGVLHFDLSDSGVVADVYGNGSYVPQITVDQYGRLTNVTEIAVTESGDVSGPGSSANHQLVSYDGITGKLLEAYSPLTVDNNGFIFSSLSFGVQSSQFIALRSDGSANIQTLGSFGTDFSISLLPHNNDNIYVGGPIVGSSDGGTSSYALTLSTLSTATPADIFIQPGVVASGANDGASVNIMGGLGSADGSSSGNVNITAPDGQMGDANGGYVVVRHGQGIGSGLPGAVNISSVIFQDGISSGNFVLTKLSDTIVDAPTWYISGAGSSTAAGTTLYITAGTSSGTANGGDIYISAGDVSGSGAVGQIFISGNIVGNGGPLSIVGAQYQLSGYSYSVTIPDQASGNLPRYLIYGGSSSAGTGSIIEFAAGNSSGTGNKGPNIQFECGGADLSDNTAVADGGDFQVITGISALGGGNAGNAIFQMQVTNGQAGSKNGVFWVQLNPAYLSSEKGYFQVGDTGNPYFKIDPAGNIVMLNGVTTNFPSSNTFGVLSNDNSGNLSWATSLTNITGIAPASGNQILITGAIAFQLYDPDVNQGLIGTATLDGTGTVTITCANCTSGAIPAAWGITATGSIRAYNNSDGTFTITSSAGLADNGLLVGWLMPNGIAP